MANENLDPQEILEMMADFMSCLDDRLGDIDARLEDFEKLLSGFEKIAQERSSGKTKEATEISVDISLRTPNLDLDEAEIKVIHNKIEKFVRSIMTHPEINGMDVQAEQKGLEKWN